MVLNKPYGLAVQGGSGTKRHIDGMLASLADEKGERPVLVHRLDRDTSGVLLVAKSRRDRGRSSAKFFARARRRKSIGRWSKACRSRRRDASRCFSPRARAWATRGRARAHKERANREKMRIAKHGDEECAAFRHLLRRGRQGRAAARLAVDEADHRPHASIARPCRSDRPSDHRRSEIFGRCR